MTSSNGNIFRVTGLCAWNSPLTGEFPTQRPVTRSFYVFFDLHPNERLSKQSRRWWFEAPWRTLWRHCNGTPDRCPPGPKTSWQMSQIDPWSSPAPPQNLVKSSSEIFHTSGLQRCADGNLVSGGWNVSFMTTYCTVPTVVTKVGIITTLPLQWLCVLVISPVVNRPGYTVHF